MLISPCLRIFFNLHFDLRGGPAPRQPPFSVCPCLTTPQFTRQDMIFQSYNYNSLIWWPCLTIATASYLSPLKFIIKNFTAYAGTHFSRIWAEVNIARIYRFAKSGLADPMSSVHVQRVYTLQLVYRFIHLTQCFPLFDLSVSL